MVENSTHLMLRLLLMKVNFTPEQATKSQKGGRGKHYSFFNLGARWGWMVNAMLRPLYPLERPGTHCIGGWGVEGGRAGLDGCGKCPHRDSISDSPVPALVTDEITVLTSRY